MHPWLKALLRSPGLRYGILTGFVGALLFLTFHHFLIKPIWVRAAPRALGLAVVGGGLVGLLYERLRTQLPTPSPRRGALFGFLVSLFVLPFLLAGLARTSDAPPLFVFAILVVLLAAVLLLYLGLLSRDNPAGPALWRRVGFVALAAVLLNGYPAYFLLFLGTIITSHVTNPFPITTALVVTYVGAGQLLETLLARHERR